MLVVDRLTPNDLTLPSYALLLTILSTSALCFWRTLTWDCCISDWCMLSRSF